VTHHTLGLSLVLALTAAGAPALAEAPKRQFDVPALDRTDFNRLAVHLGSPLFWVADRNRNGLCDPDELGATGRGATLAPFVAKGQFTPRFIRDYKALVEARRREAVAREVDAGRPTLITSDLSALPAEEKALLKQLVDAAYTIEELYLYQTGGYKHFKASAKLDPSSKAILWRNHGPWCEAPTTRGDRFCNAAPTFPPKRSEAYPLDLEQDEAFCKKLGAQPNAKELLDPFTVIQKDGEKFRALPLHHVWGKKMKLVATRLKAAAGAIAKLEGEKALYKYLAAAAKGFETNSWGEADEAWAAMNSDNSKWYLRVGPDEVYFDPCQQKAGFHMSLARIDQASRDWQRKLTPLRAKMEQEIAKLIGPPYKARDVKFHMPDFIRVVLNAGDSRHPYGGTIGQSLPNWGAVAREGRGRTVVMSNLYEDADSKRQYRLQAQALLSKESMAAYTDDATPALIGIILHEATHNFGPHSDYQIAGKPAKAFFRGAVASTLEELKAQTGSLWYLPMLRKHGLIDDKLLREAYTNSITWAFGHISRGMFSPSGNAQPYSQLAAIQVGSFMEAGALSFKQGKFTIHFDKLPGAVDKLLARVGRIKATGDTKGASALIDYYIKGKGHALVQEKHIARELLKFPKATFLYSVIY
jgi:hypothetical protein